VCSKSSTPQTRITHFICKPALLRRANAFIVAQKGNNKGNDELFEHNQNINKIHKEQNFTLYPIALLSDKEVDEELKKYDILKI